MRPEIAEGTKKVVGGRMVLETVGACGHVVACEFPRDHVSMATEKKTLKKLKKQRCVNCEFRDVFG